MSLVVVYVLNVSVNFTFDCMENYTQEHFAKPIFSFTRKFKNDMKSAIIID